jgi:hypothetical protein
VVVRQVINDRLRQGIATMPLAGRLEKTPIFESQFVFVGGMPVTIW